MIDDSFAESRSSRLLRGARACLATDGNADPDEQFEALLKAQAEFDRGGVAPAAVISGASEDGKGAGANLGKTRPASLFKQQRKNATRPPGATRAPAFHPELAALPILSGPAKEDLTCLAATVVEHPIVTASTKESQDDTKAQFQAPASGFPAANHRAVGKNLGCLPTRLVRNNEYDDGEENVQDEETQIDAENRRTIANATPEEIHEWQQQLLKQLGQGTIDMLKKRGQEKERTRQTSRGARKKSPCDKPLDDETLSPARTPLTTCKSNATKADAKDVPVEENKSGIMSSSMRIQLHPGDCKENYPGDSFEAFQVLAGGCIDRAELQKLQWTTPAGASDIAAVVSDESLPPEPTGKFVQLLRFDFEGRICIRSPEGEVCMGPEDAEGLHHHGAESSQAGYTLAELLLLSRSSYAAQRALALRSLACILLRARIPIRTEALIEDPALQQVYQSSNRRNDGSQAGFGMGLTVFFWHGIARGDIPKHLIEGLLDPAVQVRHAALRGIIALVDGASPSMTCDRLTAFRRPGSCAGDESIWELFDSRRLLVDAAFCEPLDAARELVWPQAPPSYTAPLTQRARVAVLTSDGGGGGGGASWPHLLRGRILGARQKDEVTGADILEPLFFNRKMYDEQENDIEIEDDATEPIEPPIILALRCFFNISINDDSLEAGVVRSLIGACRWSPSLCWSVLEIGRPHRSRWLQIIGAGDMQGRESCLQFELIRFMRVSCEVGGLAAAAWWLDANPDNDKDDSHTEWTAPTALRRMVFRAISERCIDGDLVTNACAIEGVRVWLAWLASGAGVDEIASFMPHLITFLHLLPQLEKDAPCDKSDQRWFLAALLLRMVHHIQVAVHRQTDLACNALSFLTAPTHGMCTSLCGFMMDVVEPLASSLASDVGNRAATVARQFCIAELASLLEMVLTTDVERSVAVVEPHKRAGRKLLADLCARVAGGIGNLFPDHVGVVEDEEAPWPLGGSASGARTKQLVCLKMVRCVCLLARCLEDRSLLPCLEIIVNQVKDVILELAAVTPVPTGAEASVFMVQRDPWVALFIAAHSALNAATMEHSSFAQALSICGCWATAKALYSIAGLHFEDLAEEAVLRAAFRPLAPWIVGVGTEDGQIAKVTGQMLPLLSPPACTEGPPAMSFAAAPFWTLVSAPPYEAALALLRTLTSSSAVATGLCDALAAAVPPWLPFLAFIAVLTTRFGDEGIQSWSDEALRTSLISYASIFLAGEATPSWLSIKVEQPDWLAESLRGLCDRLAKCFTDDSFGDGLLARALWAFAAPAMPQECRSVCWGVVDPAVLLLLSRALPVESGIEDDECDSPLLWPLSTYLEPLEETDENVELIQSAASTLGIEGCLSSSDVAGSWPARVVSHHLCSITGRGARAHGVK